MTDYHEEQSGQSAAALRTRRRGSALDDVLLRAAWEEVDSVGYARLTIEGVALRAQAHKSVIYRRWPNRASLIQAALRHRLGKLAAQFPDTGNLREDVLIVLRSYRDYVAGIKPEVIHGLIGEFTDVSRDLYEVVPSAIITALRRAAERGDISADRITPRIAALPDILLRHELLSPNGDTSDASLAAIIDETFLPLVQHAST
jgi:AcrR family transcriptional regulator